MAFEEWLENYKSKHPIDRYLKDAWDAGVANEREACAKTCDDFGEYSKNRDDEIERCACFFAKYIRARGESK